MIGFTPIAHASEPKWFVREAVGKGEKELASGEIGLKLVTEKISMTIFTAIFKEGVEQNQSADDCNKSLVEGVKVVGGSPGSLKIKKLVLTGCEEALSENCKISSSAEEAKFENLTGELVHLKGGGVGILFKLPNFTFNMTCKEHCPKMGTETFKSEVLAHVDSDGYSEEVEVIFSPLFFEYLSNPAEEAKTVISTGSGIIPAEKVKYEGKFEGTSEGVGGEKEIKAE
jgi:hypothetical protein